MCLYRNVVLALEGSCPDEWKDLLVDDFLVPLREANVMGGSKNKRSSRAFSLTGGNDDTIDRVKQYILLLLVHSNPVYLFSLSFSHLPAGNFVYQVHP